VPPVRMSAIRGKLAMRNSFLMIKKEVDEPQFLPVELLNFKTFRPVEGSKRSSRSNRIRSFRRFDWFQAFQTSSRENLELDERETKRDHGL